MNRRRPIRAVAQPLAAAAAAAPAPVTPPPAPVSAPTSAAVAAPDEIAPEPHVTDDLYQDSAIIVTPNIVQCDADAPACVAPPVVGVAPIVGAPKIAAPKQRVVVPRAAIAKKSTRGPGRPKKQDISSTAEIAGIVSAPCDPTNVLELHHHTPSVFRKLVFGLRNYAVSEVDLLFNHTGMHVRTSCALDKNNIYFDVDGQCVTWFYCAEPISVSVKLDSLINVMAPISKYHNKIIFMIKGTQKDKLWCVMHETEMGSNTRYRIDTIARPMGHVPRFEDDESRYPVLFKYNSQELKKLVANTTKISDKMILSKCTNSDLQIRILQNNLCVEHNYPSNKIGLVSKMDDPDDVVTATVTTKYVKQFTDTIIGDVVTISFDRAESMCFASSTGERAGRFAFTARVFIKLG